MSAAQQLGVDADTGDNEMPLRWRALVYFTLEAPHISVAEMSRTSPFSSVSLRTLQTWSAQDEWPRRRREALDDQYRRIKSDVADRLAKKQLENLARLEDVQAKAIAALEADVVQPRSFEGMVGALVKVPRLIEDIREKVWNTVAPEQEPPTPPRLTPNLTPAEARATARLILEMRRRAKQAKHDAPT